MPSSFLYAVLLALVLGVGCGEKAPPGEAANKLFVEATMQMAEAVSKDDDEDFAGAIADYEQVVTKVRKIVNDYPESDIAVKLVSGEASFTGQSLEELEFRVMMLKGKQKRSAKAELITNPIVEEEIRSRINKPTIELTKADLEKVKVLHLGGNQLTDMKSLEKVTQLTLLNLSYNQLTDVKGLENLTQLHTLSLRDNQLTSVRELEKLTQLGFLFLQNNPALSKAQIDQLQKALPNCKIYSNPTK